MSLSFETQAVAKHFGSLAGEYEEWKRKASYYYRYVMAGLREIIPPGRHVLEIGCGTGAILDSLRPSVGLGIDLSPEMIAVAREKRPHLRFEVGDIERLRLTESFDYIVMVDLVEHVSNLRGAFDNLARMAGPETTVVSSSANPLWAPVLHLAEYFKLKMPEGDHRWPSSGELQILIESSGFEIIGQDYRMIMPKRFPWISETLNRLYPRQGPLAQLALIQIVIFRKRALL